MRVFIVFGDAIYSRGTQAALGDLPEVSSITHAGSVAQALQSTALTESDVVLVDAQLTGVSKLLDHCGRLESPRVVLCDRTWDAERVLSDGELRAAGFLVCDSLTPESLAAAMRAAAVGVAVLDDRLLHRLMETTRLPTSGTAVPAETNGRLSEREHAVISLVAEGLPTREIACRMSYSERTVKNVLHDVVTKFGARTRSQAVAFAIRERII